MGEFSRVPGVEGCVEGMFGDESMAVKSNVDFVLKGEGR